MQNILCTCTAIYSRTIPAPNKASKIRHVIIMELYIPGVDLKIKKFFNKKPTNPNAVCHKKGSFAKLYRSTLGENPVKRFSEVQRLLKNLLGYGFIVDCEEATDSNGLKYLNVTSIKPENPVENEGWRLDGTLNPPQKNSISKHNNYGKNQGETWDKLGISLGETWENKSLQAPISLGLKPILNRLTTYQRIQPNNLITGTPKIDFNFESDELDVFEYYAPEPEIIADDLEPIVEDHQEAPQEPKVFYWRAMPGESKDEYQDRIIADSTAEFWPDENIVPTIGRIFCYRTTEKPESELKEIMPTTSLAEATKCLQQHFGKKLITVYPMQNPVEAAKKRAGDELAQRRLGRNQAAIHTMRRDVFNP